MLMEARVAQAFHALMRSSKMKTAHVALPDRLVRRVRLMACHVVVDRWMLREAPSVLVRVAVKLSLQIPIVFVALRGRPVRRVRAVVSLSVLADQWMLMEAQVVQAQHVHQPTLLDQVPYAALPDRLVQMAGLMITLSVVVDQWMLMETLSVQVRDAHQLSLQMQAVCVALRGRPVRRAGLMVTFSAVADLFRLQMQKRVAKVQIVQVLTSQMQAVLAARKTLQSSCAVQQEKYVVANQ